VGIFKSVIKSVLTGSKQYVTRYESAILAKSAIIELCRVHKFQAFQVFGHKDPVEIAVDSDLSDNFLASIEVDLVNNTRFIFVGMGRINTSAYRKMLSGKISSDEYHRCYRWSLHNDLFIGHYHNSSDIVQMVLERVKWLEERQRKL